MFGQICAFGRKIRGIGKWTADMFAMFHVGRPNVLPVGDLGVQKGVAVLFAMSKLPGPAQMTELTSDWAPWRTVGSWYMWKVQMKDRSHLIAAVFFG